MIKHDKKRELTGQKFGKLTVISSAPSNGGKRQWLCQCDCGNKEYKSVSTGDLCSNKVSSCGCLKSEHQLKDVVGLKFNK